MSRGKTKEEQAPQRLARTTPGSCWQDLLLLFGVVISLEPAARGGISSLVSLVAEGLAETGIKRWIAKRSEGDPLVEAAGHREPRHLGGDYTDGSYGML